MHATTMRCTILLLFTVLISTSNAVEETYDDNTEVVPEKMETHKCRTNEVWMECGTCEHKCGEPKTPCPRMCKPAQCQCPPHKGFRRDQNGACVECD